MSALKAMMDAWPLPDGEPFTGETLRADGWQYRDLEHMTHDQWAALSAIIGDENIRAMTWANYGATCRGQVWISPAGMDRLRSFAPDKPRQG